MDDKECRLILAHIKEEGERVRRDHIVRHTSFYYPSIINKIEEALDCIPEICYNRYGGYQEAERTAFHIYPSYMEQPNQDFIQVLKVTWPPQYYCITHRDLMGAILGLGIKREIIGDIIVSDGMCYVFVLSELAEYIMTSLTYAGKAPLSIEITDCRHISLPVINTKIINTTVSSPRLDSIVSACFGLSRTKALPHIVGGAVRVNWELVTKPDYILHEEDVLSIRGIGKGKIVSFGHTTKKDRLTIHLIRYI